MNKEKIIKEVYDIDRTIKDKKIMEHSFCFGIIFSIQTISAIWQQFPKFMLVFSVLGMFLSLVLVELSVFRTNTVLSLFLDKKNPDKRLQRFSILGKIISMLFHVLVSLLILTTVGISLFF